jgi:hypothetical protein
MGRGIDVEQPGRFAYPGHSAIDLALAQQRGTLRCAFEAVAANIALLVAQFGPVALNTELSSTVSLMAPDWAIGEMYLTSAGRAPARVNLPGLTGSIQP